MRSNLAVLAIVALAACGGESSEPEVPKDIPFTVTLDTVISRLPGLSTWRQARIDLEEPGYIQWMTTVGTLNHYDSGGDRPWGSDVVSWHIPEGATGTLSACATTRNLSSLYCTWRVVATE